MGTANQSGYRCGAAYGWGASTTVAMWSRTLSKLSGLVVGSLQARIATLVLGAALVTALCVGIFAFQMRRQIETQVTRDHQTVAETYAGLVDEYLASARWITETA